MIHTHELTVQSFECDMHRHVNNAVYLNYLETARMQFLRDVNFDYHNFLKQGYALFVANINISYRSPAFFGDRLKVVTTTIKRKKLSGMFLQEVMRDDELLARAEVTWACVDASGKPIPLPAQFDGPWLDPEPVNIAFR